MPDVVVPSPANALRVKSSACVNIPAHASYKLQCNNSEIVMYLQVQYNIVLKYDFDGDGNPESSPSPAGTYTNTFQCVKDATYFHNSDDYEGKVCYLVIG